MVSWSEESGMEKETAEAGNAFPDLQFTIEHMIEADQFAPDSPPVARTEAICAGFEKSGRGMV